MKSEKIEFSPQAGVHQFRSQSMFAEYIENVATKRVRKMVESIVEDVPQPIQKIKRPVGRPPKVSKALQY